MLMNNAFLYTNQICIVYYGKRNPVLPRNCKSTIYSFQITFLSLPQNHSDVRSNDNERNIHFKSKAHKKNDPQSSQNITTNTLGYQFHDKENNLNPNIQTTFENNRSGSRTNSPNSTKRKKHARGISPIGRGNCPR